MALNNNSNPSKGGPKGTAPPSCIVGANLGNYSYYSGSNPYANLIHGSLEAWRGADLTPVDSLGWITNMANGAPALNKYIITNVTYGGNHVKPGRYGIKWTGPLTVSVVNNGYQANIVTSDHRVEFDLVAFNQGTSRATFIDISVTNTSGSAASVNDIAVFHLDDESEVIAGRPFQREFINNLAGFKIIRPMDFMNINSSPIVNYADIPTEAHCSWGPPPISVIGKMIAACNADLWMCAFHKATDACLNSIAQELYAQMGGGTMSVHGEGSNETWNYAPDFNQGAWIRDNIAPGISVVDTNGAPSAAENDKIACGTAHLSMRFWKALETYFPRSRVVRVFSGQAANFATLAGGFEYKDTTNVLYGGAALKTLVDTYAIAPYFNISVGGGLVPADMSKKAQITRQDANQSNTFWSNAIALEVDTYGKNWISNSKTQLAAKGANIKLTSYELGAGLSLDSSITADLWPATVVANTLDFGINVTGIFSNGDKMCYQYSGGTALFSGAGHYSGFLLKLSGTNAIRVFSSQANYDSDTAATLNSYTVTGGSWSAGTATLNMASAAGLLVGHEIKVTGTTPSGFNTNLAVVTGVTANSVSYAVAVDPGAWTSGGVISITWYIDNLTRVLALANKYKSMMDSTFGVEQYKKNMEMCASYGMLAYMQFHLYAGYTHPGESGSHAFQWGLKRSVWDSDDAYPRAAFLRRFANGT
jgi:hypothetical protein